MSNASSIHQITSSDPSLPIAVQVNLLAVSCALNTGFVDISKLTFYPEFRELCAVNTCHCYGSTWACPPGVGTLEECIARIRSYDKMLLFSKVYQLEDSFDFEGMADGQKDFRARVTKLSEAVSDLLPNI